MFTPFQRNDLDGLAGQRVAIVHPTIDELPRSAQGYTTNNVYPGFPPIMADGRALIASWQPEAVENDAILKNSGIKSNWEYRKYLTQNAHQIMRQNFESAANDMGYYERGGMEPGNSEFSPMFSTMPKRHANPSLYKSILEPEQEYGRFESDLKANYLSREQLAARMVSPVVTQAELFKMMAQPQRR